MQAKTSTITGIGKSEIIHFLGQDFEGWNLLRKILDNSEFSLNHILHTLNVELKPSISSTCLLLMSSFKLEIPPRNFWLKNLTAFLFERKIFWSSRRSIDQKYELLMQRVWQFQHCSRDSCNELHTKQDSWRFCQPWQRWNIQICWRQGRLQCWTSLGFCLGLG